MYILRLCALLVLVAAYATGIASPSDFLTVDTTSTPPRLCVLRLIPSGSSSVRPLPQGALRLGNDPEILKRGDTIFVTARDQANSITELSRHDSQTGQLLAFTQVTYGGQPVLVKAMASSNMRILVSFDPQGGLNANWIGDVDPVTGVIDPTSLRPMPADIDALEASLDLVIAIESTPSTRGLQNFHRILTNPFSVRLVGYFRDYTTNLGFGFGGPVTLSANPPQAILVDLGLTGAPMQYWSVPSGLRGLESVDGVAHFYNYGTDWPGARGAPQLSMQTTYSGIWDLLLTNSTTSNRAYGVVLFGSQSANVPTQLGGQLNVNPLAVLPVDLLGPATSLRVVTPGHRAQYPVNPVYAQLLVLDPAASHGIAFSRGLVYRPGY